MMDVIRRRAIVLARGLWLVGIAISVWTSIMASPLMIPMVANLATVTLVEHMTTTVTF